MNQYHILLITAWILLLIGKYWPFKTQVIENEKIYRLSFICISLGVFLADLILIVIDKF